MGLASIHTPQIYVKLWDWGFVQVRVVTAVFLCGIPSGHPPPTRWGQPGKMCHLCGHSIKWSLHTKARAKSRESTNPHPWSLSIHPLGNWKISEFKYLIMYLKIPWLKKGIILKIKTSIRRHSPLKAVLEKTFYVSAHAFRNMCSYNFYKACHRVKHGSWGEMPFWHSRSLANMSHTYRE